jgi:hypothetical protein
MKKESARNPTPEQLHKRRKQFVQLRRQSIKIMQIVATAGLGYPTVSAAIEKQIKRADEQSPAAVQAWLRAMSCFQDHRVRYAA